MPLLGLNWTSLSSAPSYFMLSHRCCWSCAWASWWNWVGECGCVPPCLAGHPPPSHLVSRPRPRPRCPTCCSPTDTRTCSRDSTRWRRSWAAKHTEAETLERGVIYRLWHVTALLWFGDTVYLQGVWLTDFLCLHISFSLHRQYINCLCLENIGRCSGFGEIIWCSFKSSWPENKEKENRRCSSFLIGTIIFTERLIFHFGQLRRGSFKHFWP